MRLVTFESAGKNKVGILEGDEIIDVGATDPAAPTSLREIIDRRYDLSRVLQSKEAVRVQRASVKLLQPVPNPSKVICLGLNYAAHAAEGNSEVTEVPTLFLRLATSLISADEPMVVPRVSEKLDYEAELMVIIGKGGRHISKENALEHVFGYSIFNDGSIRDYQRATTQWTSGKNFDRTGPFGPFIVTADELPPGAKGLRIRSVLNGKTMQDANTKDMIFDIPTIIAFISTIVTLEPGDCIATGTPQGVGGARATPVWLKPGDTIVVEIEKIGRLESQIIAES